MKRMGACNECGHAPHLAMKSDGFFVHCLNPDKDQRHRTAVRETPEEAIAFWQQHHALPSDAAVLSEPSPPPPLPPGGRGVASEARRGEGSHQPPPSLPPGGRGVAEGRGEGVPLISPRTERQLVALGAEYLRDKMMGKGAFTRADAIAGMGVLVFEDVIHGITAQIAAGRAANDSARAERSEP